MRMTVVGGSRGTGAQVVRIAAEAGHQVTCLSRNGAPAPIGGVSYLTGDALNAEVAQAAVSGADAVVVSVGGATGSDRHRAEVTRSIIAAMRDAGVRRLIVHSSLGVGDSMQLMPAPARVFAKAVLGRALADHAEQEAAVARTPVRRGEVVDERNVALVEHTIELFEGIVIVRVNEMPRSVACHREDAFLLREHVAENAKDLLVVRECLG